MSDDERITVILDPDCMDPAQIEAERHVWVVGDEAGMARDEWRQHRSVTVVFRHAADTAIMIESILFDVDLHHGPQSGRRYVEIDIIGDQLPDLPHALLSELGLNCIRNTGERISLVRSNDTP